jgi:hypothetical protein
MSKKIFDDRGFLNADGKAFVNEVFTKEVKKILSTAYNANDVHIISGILKSIVGEAACNQIQKLERPSPEPSPTPEGPKHEEPTNLPHGGLKLVKPPTTTAKVIPFPHTPSIDLEALVGALSDAPFYVM